MIERGACTCDVRRQPDEIAAEKLAAVRDVDGEGFEHEVWWHRGLEGVVGCEEEFGGLGR